MSDNRWWWQEEGWNHDWRGVFQGGGAKGVAYVGALKAFAARRQWFREVAGASAGAITGALIAAGYTPNDMVGLSRSLLNSLRPATWVDRALRRLPGVRNLVTYDSSDLEAGTGTRAMSKSLGLPSDAPPVTFRQLSNTRQGYGH